MDPGREEFSGPPRSWILAPGSFPLIFPLKSGCFPVLSSLLYGEESLD